MMISQSSKIKGKGEGRGAELDGEGAWDSNYELTVISDHSSQTGK